MYICRILFDNIAILSNFIDNMSIQLDTQNLSKLGYNFHVDYDTKSKELYQRSKEFKAQGFVDLPYQTQTIEEIKNGISKFKNQFDTIVILGIGGSMLGPQTILDALYFGTDIKVICLDNIDPFVIQKTTETLNLSKTLFLVQTKSGGTPETIAQFLYFRDLVEKNNYKIEDKFIFVTDPTVGYLREVANSNPAVACFEIPSNVGGRFSVLTSMGLLIMELLGLDTKAILEGAKHVIENQKSTAFEFANIQTELYKQGLDQNVLMPYSSRLGTFARWYIQLLSESIGKEFDLDGKKVNHGITPIPALGATDQHSQAQLFKEGPNNKLIILIKVEDHKSAPIISTKTPSSLSYLENKTFEQLINAELEGTLRSLTESSKPNLLITIPEVNEFYLGALFMFFELSTAYIGEMLNLNTFDQPGVERAKILAKEILS
jgi:glucose-6-phosphate isomerase